LIANSTVVALWFPLVQKNKKDKKSKAETSDASGGEEDAEMGEEEPVVKMEE
jgi:hypothetical protein